ncbi:MAG: 16S rRNA (adenine(1518)-N(6)/adenine(1519)-N(6))-dimethyltransferase RsmA, partial [Verrucomicrobiota bacterium]|nr:16S rRNA (adenine(1518)-N(6)/adenine(1519)-N(6))-dimethyltransferase RsmA [Verrucomicrobiota bacterium]
MTPTQIKKILNDIELRPSKKLGQNFLTDGNILDIIMKAVKVSAKDEVLEIGPGTGALTAELLKTGAHITAVEYDHRLADYLKAEYQGNNKLKIIQGDACKMGWNELFLNHEFKCFGNLPYAISSIFISSLLEMENPPVEAVFMLQKEMADRLVASCNTKEYSSLSVRLQKFYDIEVV